MFEKSIFSVVATPASSILIRKKTLCRAMVALGLLVMNYCGLLDSLGPKEINGLLVPPSRASSLPTDHLITG